MGTALGRMDTGVRLGFRELPPQALSRWNDVWFSALYGLMVTAANSLVHSTNVY